MTQPRVSALVACSVAVSLGLSAAAEAAVPRAATLSRGWQVRAEQAPPADPQQPPAEESPPTEEPPPQPPVAPAPTPEPEVWLSARVPGVFDPIVAPTAYPGEVKVYRLRFRGPPTPDGFSWLLQFESVRRRATVRLNGRLIGRNADPYTPFTLEARGLRPGRTNELVVRVDSRKDERLREGWWNWGGIVRPVRLVPVGPVALRDVGYLPRVRCRGQARGCKAALLVDAVIERRTRGSVRPVVDVRLAAPGGRVIRKRFELARQEAARRRLQLLVPVPAPELWSPDNPQLYGARVSLRLDGRVVQVDRRAIGLRSVQVKRGLLYLNNRRIVLRGASIHEDMPGRGAALTRAANARIVADLQALGANVTRAHYLLNEDLLRRLDRAGIMVWSQAPIWQRDHGANLLQYPSERRKARATVRRTVMAARNHPAVIVHSVANELTFTPDLRFTTRLFLEGAARDAREVDPTLPIAVDIKGRPGFALQRTYRHFDALGINQYFGWYSWVADFNTFEPYLQEMRDFYPDQALVITEFGAEARPNQRDGPVDEPGSWAYQSFHIQRNLDVIDRQPRYSGAIYWTLREFEIYPGWTGGPGARSTPGAPPNMRHHKGLVTYGGEPKPGFYYARDRFAAVPLYAAARARSR
jgi:beta-glucuronidase